MIPLDELERKAKAVLAAQGDGLALSAALDAFDYAANALRAKGHQVFSPAERDRSVHGGELEKNATGSEDEAASNVGFSLREALKADCDWICEYADTIALLPGWEKSRGANAEFALANALGLNVMMLGREYVA